MVNETVKDDVDGQQENQYSNGTGSVIFKW